MNALVKNTYSQSKYQNQVINLENRSILLNLSVNYKITSSFKICYRPRNRFNGDWAFMNYFYLFNADSGMNSSTPTDISYTEQGNHAFKYRVKDNVNSFNWIWTPNIFNQLTIDDFVIQEVAINGSVVTVSIVKESDGAVLLNKTTTASSPINHFMLKDVMWASIQNGKENSNLALKYVELDEHLFSFNEKKGNRFYSKTLPRTYYFTPNTNENIDDLKIKI